MLLLMHGSYAAPGFGDFPLVFTSFATLISVASFFLVSGLPLMFTSFAALVLVALFSLVFGLGDLVLVFTSFLAFAP